MLVSRVSTVFTLGLLSAGAQYNPDPTSLGPVNLNFAAGPVGKVPQGWYLPPTHFKAGNSAELRREGCHGTLGCAVLLPPATPSNRDGVLWQRFQAAPYRGATVRLRAWVRLQSDDPRSMAKLWFRVDRPRSQSRGFFDSMDDRPVHSSEWQLCEIVGKVAVDAEYLGIGLTSFGPSAAWFDDVSLDVVDSGTTPVNPAVSTIFVNGKPENLDFSQGRDGQVPRGWFVPPTLAALGYRAELRHEECRSLTGCAVLLTAPTQTDKNKFGNLMQAFPAEPHRGHTIRVRAWIRIDAEASTDRAQMWLRIDGDKEKFSLLDNMSDRPVQSSSWQLVELVRNVPTGADRINIGLISFGKGDAWIDGVTIEDAPGATETGVLSRGR